jgi:PAS domain S-box-containing protein
VENTLDTGDPEGTQSELSGILSGLAQRLRDGVRATIEALGQSHAQRLAALVESSDDAILSVDLGGIIATWNKGAEQLFGYETEEIIGKSVTALIPADRQGEEPKILDRIGRGEHIEHYETVRLCKDGRLIVVSLTVSPVADTSGTIIGASKIARDIAERKLCAMMSMTLRSMPSSELWVASAPPFSFLTAPASSSARDRCHPRHGIVALGSQHAGPRADAR